MTDLRIGLALGGGSARGLAHITMLEAFDELGIKPSIIAGCSMGALIGAAYASGFSAKEIAEHACNVLGNKIDAARHIFSNPNKSVFNLVELKGFGAVRIDGAELASLVLPQGHARHVEDTEIPLKIVATDFHAQKETIFTKGPLVQAVAASMAIPGLIAAPEIDGRLYVDGGMTNPVPFDLITNDAEFIVAVDVTGKPPTGKGGHLTNFELASGAMLTMFRQIAKLKREHAPPQVYIEPAINKFTAADFFKVREILATARPAKEDLKRALELRLNAVT
jgi:NTE family protein